MVAEGDEQVEEKLTTTVEHLKLHRAATLECGPTANDESEVMSTQLGVGIGCVGVGITGGGQDGAALDSGLCRPYCQHL